MKNFLFFTLFFSAFSAYPQLSWNGSQTITTAGRMVNRYAPISADIAQSTSTFVYAPSHSFSLCPGDLVMIYQAQGASINATNTNSYGVITNYNSAGLYEFKYVQAINGTTVTVQTAFTNSYSALGKTQAIRVERYDQLTINAGASIVPKEWKDTIIGPITYRFGGVVALTATTIANNGTISANGAGFRGGALSNDSMNTVSGTSFQYTSNTQGGEKGESIAGYKNDYDALGGRYCRGAPANGGGGGDAHNAGGAGGANGNNGAVWTGEGVMVVDGSNLLSAWALSSAYIANGNSLSNSSGGGHGGYTYGTNVADPSVQGPNNSAWGGDSRREVGGIGGRPLTNISPESRVYFGGGGGAAHENDNLGSSGADGGGIVYLVANNITGSGIISANGNTAPNTTGANHDGAGGGGGGGSIVIKTTALVPTQTVKAVGGKGGDQLFIQTETEGPGGGGGGGLVALSAGAVTPQIDGGLNGVSFADILANKMTSNGATKGANGQTLTVSSAFITYTSTVVGNSNLSSNSPLCVGKTLSLTTSYPGPVFNWSGPNNFSASVQNPTLLITSVSMAGLYILNAPGTCFQGLVVEVVPQPTFALTGATITCLNPTVTLSAITNYTGSVNSNITFNWSSPSFTSANQVIDATAPGNYTCTMTDLYTNCSVQHAATVGIDQVPPVTTVNPVNQNITCGPGVVATVTGTAINPTVNVTHSWYSPGIDVPVQGGGQSSIFGIGAPGTYTHVLLNMVNGCSTTKTVQVVSSLGYPVFNVFSPQSFTVGCATKSFAIVNIQNQNTTPVGGALNFAMLPPGFSQATYTYGPAFNFTFTTPGNYTLIAQDDNNGCETRITVPIIQDIFPPNATVDVLNTRTLTCYTPSAVLQGISTTTNVSYSWSFQNGQNPNTVPNASTTVTTNTNTAISATVVNVYTLTVLNNNNQCKTTTLVPIYQNIRPPKPRINGASPLTCNVFEQTLQNGSDKDGAPGFFAPLATAAIKWEGPSPQITNEDTVASYKALTVGIYTMTVMDRNNGCFTNTTVLVGDNRVYPVLLTNTFVALDCGSNGVNLAVTAVGLKPADIKAMWTTPLPTPEIKNPNTLTLTTNGIGQYSLAVTTTSNGCGSSIKVIVTNGTLTSDFTPDVTTGFAPLTVNFTNNTSSTSSLTGTSSVTSVWSFGNGTTRTTTSNVTTSAVYEQAGTYTVTMFASKGSCSDSVLRVIRVDIASKLEVPNVFTPNGDNINDVFFVKASNLTQITALVYDRWGNKVYELNTDKGNIAWDGKNLLGHDSQDGAYFYIITAKGKDGQNYDAKGTVTLMR